jgi:hypothetical protein
MPCSDAALTETVLSCLGIMRGNINCRRRLYLGVRHTAKFQIPTQFTHILQHRRTMTSQKVALILGSGPNIGQSVSRAFAAKGYKIALASRSVKAADNSEDQINFKVDLSDPPTVSELFAKVKETVGIPSVVVYNGTCSSAYNALESHATY